MIKQGNLEFYRVGKDEQGVLICEPYKSEIGKYWRFKTPEMAKESSEKIHKLFQHYLAENEFRCRHGQKIPTNGIHQSQTLCKLQRCRKYDTMNDYAQLVRGTGAAEKAEASAISMKNGEQPKQNQHMQN